MTLTKLMIWVCNGNHCWDVNVAVLGASYRFSDNTSLLRWFHQDSRIVTDNSTSRLPNSDCNFLLMPLRIVEVFWCLFLVEPLLSVVVQNPCLLHIILRTMYGPFLLSFLIFVQVFYFSIGEHIQSLLN